MGTTDSRKAFWSGMATALTSSLILTVLALLFGIDPWSRGHRQGVIDHVTGEWQAEYHEPTDSWKVWEVDDV